MQELKQGFTLRDGKYRIEKVLGQGGFGITYLAKMQTSVPGSLGALEVEVDVAIKEFFIKERLVRDESGYRVTAPSVGSRELVDRFRRKFIKEARNIASMNHRNIVKVSDVFEENGTVYYVMQFLSGGSLSQYVRSHAGGRLSADEAVQIAKQVGSALRYMHEERQTCHLDVKPGNILRNKNGEAVLIDFGLSKNYDGQGNQTSSTPVGLSSGYAPIEQYQQALNSFSPQTDVYSLGATVYFMLTGQTPPEASIINEDGFPECPSYVDRRLWAVVEKAMEPRRRDRYQSVAAMLNALDNYAVQEETVVSDEDDETVIEVEEPARKSGIKPEPEPVVEEDEAAGGFLKSKTFKWIIGVIAGLIIAGMVGNCGAGCDGYSVDDFDTLALDSGVYKFVNDQEVLDLDGNVAYTYSGYVDDNGKPHFEGTAKFPKNDKFGRIEYTGNFDHGQREGAGKLIYKDGSQFEGLFNNGHFSEGKFTLGSDGSYFEGKFANDNPSSGKWFDKDGTWIDTVGTPDVDVDSVVVDSAVVE